MDPATIAAIIGSIVQAGGSLYDRFSGAGEEQNKPIPLYSPEQQQAFSQLLQQGLGGLSQQAGGGFAPFEQQARERFQEQTVPSIAERFAGQGDSGARNRAFAQAGRGLETDLSAQRMENLHRMLGLGLTQQSQPRIHQEPGFFQSMEPYSAQLLSQLFKMGDQGKSNTMDTQKPIGSVNVGQAPTLESLAKLFGAPSQRDIIGGRF